MEAKNQLDMTRAIESKDKNVLNGHPSGLSVDAVGSSPFGKALKLLSRDCKEVIRNPHL